VSANRHLQKVILTRQTGPCGRQLPGLPADLQA
jgi:hypothetical protein